MARTLNKKKHELLDILDDFMTDCKYRDLRRASIRLYERSLKLLFKFLKNDYNIIFEEDVKEEHIRNYIKITKERGDHSYV
ncbi:integrase, partial [Clostridium perfringens]|nr:integrase [Clostridium perfringens]